MAFKGPGVPSKGTPRSRARCPHANETARMSPTPEAKDRMQAKVNESRGKQVVIIFAEICFLLRKEAHDGQEEALGERRHYRLHASAGRSFDQIAGRDRTKSCFEESLTQGTDLR